MKLYKIKFGGEELLLLGSKKEGVITTQELYKNDRSFAYLYPDGIVKRFNKPIGTREQIEFEKIK